MTLLGLGCLTAALLVGASAEPPNIYEQRWNLTTRPRCGPNDWIRNTNGCSWGVVAAEPRHVVKQTWGFSVQMERGPVVRVGSLATRDLCWGVHKILHEGHPEWTLGDCVPDDPYLDGRK